MSASNEYTEWHLTPRGWERGTEKTDFQERINRNPPPDTILSYKYYEFMSSPFSRMERGTNLLFGNPEDIATQEFLKKYGNCPYNL